MKLSILILSHNRPLLFKRALMSILDNAPEYEFEIIVNNDSNDIEEVHDAQANIRYFYESYDDLSDTYKLLYTQARGEYIYYLEDDDYIESNFFSVLDFTYDINYLEYISTPLMVEVGIIEQFKRMSVNRKSAHIHNLKAFLSNHDDRDFQLGQLMFKQELVHRFPSGNNIYNDMKLFENLGDCNTSIKYIPEQCWVQTIDAADNISFTDLNIDERFR
jgi:glycosyltransferase involved in cell wall biosynthesis